MHVAALSNTEMKFSHRQTATVNSQNDGHLWKAKAELIQKLFFRARPK